jgi:hypothetical protein
MKSRLMMSMVFGLALSAPAAEPSEFPLAKALEPEGAARGTIGRFEIDEELFDGADGRFGNVRILDGGGTAVPFLVRTVCDRRRVVTEHDIPVKTLAFELLEDNRFRVEVECTGREEDPRPASVLAIESNVRDFEKTVSVWGSPDRRTWSVLAENEPVYDYSRYLDLRKDRVPLAAGRRRFYRVEVSNIAEERRSPLVQIARETRGGELASKIEQTSLRREDYRVEAVRLIEAREAWSDTEPALRDYGAAGFSAEPLDGGKVTEVRFGTRSVPLREVRFDVADTFFSRAVTLEGHVRLTGEEGWAPVARGTLQRLPGGEREAGCVVKPPAAGRYRRYRARIENLDSPPLEIGGVSVKGETMEGVFLCDGGGPYRVVYGAEEVAPPRYDMDRIVSGAGRDAMAVHRLGAETANHPYRKARCAWLRSGKALLIPAVLLMVGVLAWLLIKAARRVGGQGDAA